MKKNQYIVPGLTIIELEQKNRILLSGSDDNNKLLDDGGVGTGTGGVTTADTKKSMFEEDLWGLDYEEEDGGFYY